MVTRWAGWEQRHPGTPVSSPESSSLSGLSASQLTGRVGQLPGQRNGCFDHVSGHSSFWGDDGVPPQKPGANPRFHLASHPAGCLPGPLVPARALLWAGCAAAGTRQRLLPAPGRRPDKWCFHVHSPRGGAVTSRRQNAQDLPTELHPVKCFRIAPFSITRPFFQMKVWIHVSL